jgi:hypothetical protein
MTAGSKQGTTREDRTWNRFDNAQGTLALFTLFVWQALANWILSPSYPSHNGSSNLANDPSVRNDALGRPRIS